MASRRIFVSLPSLKEFSDVFEAIRAAAERSERNTKIQYELFRADSIAPGADAEIEIQKELVAADLVIADTSGATSNVLYEVGYAMGLDKPIVFINQRDFQVPFDLAWYHFTLYDRERLTADLVPQLIDVITAGIEQPEIFMKAARNKEAKNENKPSAFISYSHADKECLKRLQIHVRPLVKMGIIEIWEDTQIKVGDKWKDEIEAALERSVIAVLLISADFLASDFIVDNELPPILAAAEAKGTRILPVILRPCRFSRDAHLKQFQAINSPDKPLLTLDEIAQEQVWDMVSNEIENEIRTRKTKKP